AATKGEGIDGISKALSVGEWLFENGVCLPSDTKMTDEDLDRVIGIIKGLWG
ncbi:MAG: hypothetical protein GX963_07305, partial [Bacteroidales bacterium]|nr:hypothetical protein [Bacteroidales bacterium]